MEREFSNIQPSSNNHAQPIIQLLLFRFVPFELFVPLIALFFSNRVSKECRDLFHRLRFGE